MAIQATDPEDGVFRGGVVVPSRATRVFQERIVILKSLNLAFGSSNGRKAVDAPQGSDLEPEDLFRAFLDRLGQICDCRPGGTTVTAFVVVSQPDKIQYAFVSNQRREVELRMVKAYITAILESLKYISLRADDEEYQESLMRDLRRDILIFNRDRIKAYIKGLLKSLTQCLNICANLPANAGTSQQDRMKKLLAAAELTKEPDLEEDDYFVLTERLLESLQELQKPAISMFIRKRAGDETGGNAEPWRELRHHSSRLLSYTRAVDILWHAGHTWPELFDGFEIKFVPSSKPVTNPLRNLNPQSADNIMSRLLATEDKERYMQLVRDLQQAVGLDELVGREWSRKFQTFVHGEVALLNWMENDGGTKPPRFFKGWQYIGSSKPTCRLCSYYFAAHPSGVRVRGTHGNLYSGWRMPDLADVAGCRSHEEALKRRLELQQSVTANLRRDVSRVLVERVTGTRRHDSATLSSFAVGRPAAAGEGSVGTASPIEDWNSAQDGTAFGDVLSVADGDDGTDD